MCSNQAKGFIRPEAKKLLWDALRAIERVERFVDGKTFESYCEDDQLRSAVERQFEIIGEALAQFRNLNPEEAADPSSSNRWFPKHADSWLRYN
jgi:hypothetical protein